MNGIYVEKSARNDFWVVKDAKTGQLLSVGSTPALAVDNYETEKAFEEIAKGLGVSVNDMYV